MWEIYVLGKQPILELNLKGGKINPTNKNQETHTHTKKTPKHHQQKSMRRELTVVFCYLMGIAVMERDEMVLGHVLTRHEGEILSCDSVATQGGAGISIPGNTQDLPGQRS